MSGPLGQTTPSGSAFGGGAYLPASTPTAIRGVYGGPGASGFPTPGTPEILSARNNRGSNVRIPYARVVPMKRKRDDEGMRWATNVPGVRGRDGPGGLYGRGLLCEYDGLESGEVAWIEANYAAQAPLQRGWGPDRMQRLVYQGWFEAWFRHEFGNKLINMDDLRIGSPYNTLNSDQINMHKQWLGDANVLSSVDLARFFQERGQTPPPPGGWLRSGIVMTEGPFLHGRMWDETEPIMVKEQTYPRNLGDVLAFDALYAKFKALGMFKWTPDGIVLSKLESPAGEPYSSAELDARQAQLFNICMQGPAITKTWCGDPRMQVMPMDRVFIAVVADVTCTIAAMVDNGDRNVQLKTRLEEDSSKLPEDLAKKLREYAGGAEKSDDTPSEAEGQLTSVYIQAIKRLFEAYKSSGGDGKKPSQDAINEAHAEVDLFFNTSLTADEITKLDLKQKRPSAALMTNFRLMRVTSSFLTQYSPVRWTGNALDQNSRCGLRLGVKNDALVAEYIVGAWCIGTVLDSAASRATVGSQVRVAPASMALNVNVGVEWWSSDDLHRHYYNNGKISRRAAAAEWVKNNSTG